MAQPVEGVGPCDAYPAADGADVVIGVQNDRGWAAGPPAPSRAWTPSPALGEHTGAVLRELGRDDAAIAAPRSAGAVA